MKKERIWDIITAWKTGGERNSLCVVIPKPIRDALGIEEGFRFTVKTDTSGRIIFEKVE